MELERHKRQFKCVVHEPPELVSRNAYRGYLLELGANQRRERDAEERGRASGVAKRIKEYSSPAQF